MFYISESDIIINAMASIMVTDVPADADPIPYSKRVKGNGCEVIFNCNWILLVIFLRNSCVKCAPKAETAS